MTDTRPEVLFVCVHNAGRSQMAAALLANYAGDQIVVRSAGTAPVTEINPAVVEAMAEIGIDLHANGAHPKKLEDAAVQGPTWSSPWVAATSAPSTPAPATSTGSSTTQPAKASMPSDPSATRSTGASVISSLNSSQ
jgi:hypothetical protein